MPDSMQQIVAGVYTLLRRPGQAKLPYTDAAELINDALRGFLQDQSLNGRDQRTEIAEVQIVEDDTDYLLSLPNIPDFEPIKLEYIGASALSGYGAGWYEAGILPIKAWSRAYQSRNLTASFYGSASLQEGVKVKLNVDPSVAGNLRFRLTYRLPLLASVQLGERPPMPSSFLPLLKYSAAFAALDVLRDDTPETLAWIARVERKWPAIIGLWFERWKEYLEDTLEPNIQDLPVFNNFRRYENRMRGRAYLPIGE